MRRLSSWDTPTLNSSFASNIYPQKTSKGVGRRGNSDQMGYLGGWSSRILHSGGNLELCWNDRSGVNPRG